MFFSHSSILALWKSEGKTEICYSRTLVLWKMYGKMTDSHSSTLVLWNMSGENESLSLQYSCTLSRIATQTRLLLSVLSTLKGFNPKRTHTLVLSTLGVLMSRKKINTNSRTLTLHFGCWDFTLSAIRNHKSLNIKTH